jgi:hypothetical protein
MAAPAHRHAHVFPRGSNVLDYWLARAEGFTVLPLHARVERVVAAQPSGRAAKLIVRSRSRRLTAIDAASIEAVDPVAQVLVLAQQPRPSRRERAQEDLRTVAPALRRGADAAAACAATAVRWLRPHARSAAEAAAQATARAVDAGVAAGRWLAPRLADATRDALVVAAHLAVLAARAIAAAARDANRSFDRRRGVQRLPR